MMTVKVIFTGLSVMLAAVGVLSDAYYKTGGTFDETPENSLTDSIRTILWKHKKDKVAEWDSDFNTLDYYGRFKDRTTLDKETGQLVVNNLSLEDTGMFSVEVNSNELNKYSLRVINAVPKPTINRTSCKNQASCTLTCMGDPSGAEPVTYYWSKDQGTLIKGQHLTATADSNVKKYICHMTNPVSNGTDEVSKETLFNVPEANTAEVVGGVIGGGLLVSFLCGLIYFYLKKRGHRFHQTGHEDNQANTNGDVGVSAETTGRTDS